MQFFLHMYPLQSNSARSTRNVRRSFFSERTTYKCVYVEQKIWVWNRLCGYFSETVKKKELKTKLKGYQ